MQEGPYPNQAAPSPPWRAGELVVIPRSPRAIEFPDRCVICNDSAHGYRRWATLAWHPPAVYLLFLLGLLFYVIGALITRKTQIVELGLCPRHRRRRTIGIALAISGLFISIAGLIASAIESFVPGIVVATLALVALPIAGWLLARPVRVARIDQQSAVFRAGPAFVDSLAAAPPGWVGAAVPSYAPYGWAPPVPAGGWAAPGPPPARFHHEPALMAGAAQPSPGSGQPSPQAVGEAGWEIEISPAVAWRVPGFCAGCSGPITRLQRFTGRGAPRSAPWIHVGLCPACSQRHAGRWRAPTAVLAIATSAAIAVAVSTTVGDPLRPPVLFALPIVAALVVAIVARMAFERLAGRGREIVAFRSNAATRGATLWCNDHHFAASFAAWNGFGMRAATRAPRIPLAPAAVSAGLLALGAGTGAWAYQWPRVIVDHAGPKPIEVWADGERLATVEPNGDGSSPAIVRVPRGPRRLGYGPVGADAPSSTVEVEIEGSSLHLLNPGRLACHWLEISPYSTDPATAHLDPTIPWDRHGPLDREEFQTIERIDHWFEPTPDEIDMRDRNYRTAVVRDEVCTDLAQTRCPDEVVDALIDCERDAADQDELDACQLVALEVCAAGTAEL